MKVNQSLAPNGANGMQKNGSFSSIIGSPNYQNMLSTAISDPKRRTNFVSSLISAVSTTPKLKECTPDSIISAALPFVSFDFSFGTGCAYIIPYGTKAQFQMGAKGYRQLAMRAGQYKDLDTIEVREGEFLGRDENTGKPKFKFITDEDERESKPIIGYLAYFELLNGFKANVYFSKEKMIKWANRYSQSFNADLFHKYEVYQETGDGLTQDELRACSSPWFERFDAMAEKTVLKQLLSKKGILSVELQNAFNADNEGGYTEQDAPMFNAPVAEPAPVPAEEPKQESAPEAEEVPAPIQNKRGRKPKTESVVEPVVEIVEEEPPMIEEPPMQEVGPSSEDIDSLFFDAEDEQ